MILLWIIKEMFLSELQLVFGKPLSLLLVRSKNNLVNYFLVLRLVADPES